jgi:hypothetical protein
MEERAIGNILEKAIKGDLIVVSEISSSKFLET